MAPSRDESGSRNIAILLTAIVACGFVLGFAVPVTAQEHSSTSSEPIQDLFQQGDSTAFSCMDMTKEEVTTKLNSIATERINKRIQQNRERIPNSVRSAMVGERVNIKIEQTYFATVVNEEAQVERIVTRQLEDPTVRVTTDCETVKQIFESQDRQAALQAAINRGDIQWEGLTTTSQVETSYGTKAVQTYTIVESGETGDAEDAANGFSSGLMLN